MCSTCNRGIWSDSEIIVAVERNKPISLGTLRLWTCLKCGREYLAKWFVDHTKIYAARSEEALNVLESTIDDEWYGPLRRQSKRTEEIVRAINDGNVSRVPDRADGFVAHGSAVPAVRWEAPVAEVPASPTATAAKPADAEPTKRCV